MAEWELHKSKRKPGMGKGLAAILSSTEGRSSAGELREVPIAAVKANPGQPRKRFDPDALDALKDSIKSSGIIQPLLVRPTGAGEFELIAGERRLRAATELGLERLPVIVRDPAEEERLQQALIENMVREDLNPVEEARACEALVRDLGLSKQEVAKRIGRSRPALSNLIRILELPDDILELLEQGELSEGHGKAILAAADHEARRRIGRKAASEGWSVRRTEDAARRSDEDPAATGPPGGGGGRRAAPVSAEERAALQGAADDLERRLGREVKVKPSAGAIRIEIRCEDFEDLREFADGLSAKITTPG